MVIGIIVVLAGILAPAINQAYRQAQRTTMASDLQSIAVALEAFKQDHLDYPRVTGVATNRVGYDGAVALCQALLAPADGDDQDTDASEDPGFRQRPGGKVYGPYLPTGKFRTAHPTVQTNLDHTLFVLFDRTNRPILYFPASAAKPNVRVATGTPAFPYVGPSELSRYDTSDNLGVAATAGPFMRSASAAEVTNATTRIRLMLGDRDADGLLDTGEQEVDLPFVLWSAGPDETYGPDMEMAGDRTVLNAEDADKCDDVTNFER